MNNIVRKLTRSEYYRYAEHLKKLDDESKYLRFGFKAKDETIDSICNNILKNPSKHILFGVENDNLELVAVGHVAIGDPTELAFSVLKEYQNRGLGSTLVRRCIQFCRNFNIRNGYLTCLSHNHVIKHLCLKYGLRLTTEDGETLATFKLDPPTFATVINENIDNNFAIVDFLSKRTMRFWSVLP